MPFMQDSNGMMFLSPNMSAFLNSPAPNNNNSGNRGVFVKLTKNKKTAHKELYGGVHGVQGTDYH